MKSMTEISKLIAMVLRHKPEALDLTLDEHGWCSTDALVGRINARQPFSIADLQRIVETDGKQRYSFSEDGTRIRANQGHSIPVDVELPEATPPTVLYHGTATRFVESICSAGLQPRSRLYVHLSADVETAEIVGKRHGKPAIFTVDAAQMAADGCTFYLSRNGVWLTKAVPPQYLTLMNE